MHSFHRKSALSTKKNQFFRKEFAENLLVLYSLNFPLSSKGLNGKASLREGALLSRQFE